MFVEFENSTNIFVFVLTNIFVFVLTNIVVFVFNDKVHRTEVASVWYRFQCFVLLCDFETLINKKQR